MADLYINYNPYRLETKIDVNGESISSDSTLYKIVKGKRLQEWIGDFPQMLVDALNTQNFNIIFHGMALDWDDFEDVFHHAKSSGVIKKLNLEFIEGSSDEEITDKIVGIFKDLQEGPIDDFRDPKLIKAFDNINNSVFPINVIATMSSGKSTLINALLGKKLMPSKNEACTATITEILDNDREVFEAVVYNHDDVLYEIPELTYDVMNELNDNPEVSRIEAEGDIPFLDAKSMALMLVDTPGPNNSQTDEHLKTTYRAIKSDANNLILYVLNGTQLSTQDDATLLKYVAEQIKKGGKQVRDRFIFVVNKMDGFNPEEEDIGKAITSAKRYLAQYGIEDPQIFPCSAYTALNIRTYLDGVDIDNLTRSEERKLPSAARDTLPMIDKFIEYDSMHLEQYSTLSPSAKRELMDRLDRAEKNGDTKEQALVHCGIYSIEAAIKAYVKKYAKTKNVKDLVESFYEVLDEKKIFANAKEKVATSEDAAKACAERAAAVKAKIENGEEAKVFKKRIDALDPMDAIKKKAEALKAEVIRDTGRVFEPYGDTITSRAEAERLVSHFSNESSDRIAKLTSELESVIKREVIDTGNNILKEYKDKLTKIDQYATDKQLDFNTADLIKGSLNSMKENAEAWCSYDFASKTVEDVGDVSYDEKVYYEKVGEEEEQVQDGTEVVKVGEKEVYVADGTEEVKIGEKEEQVADGTEIVKVGTRKVKVGSHREKVGSKWVRNPARLGLLGKIKFWEDDFIEEAVYADVDDYKDEAVYDTIVKYKTVMKDIYETKTKYKAVTEDIYETKIKYKTVTKDIFEERKEKIEKYSVETSVIQTGLISKIRRNLDEGIKAALSYADNQIKGMKDQFSKMFDELDIIIKEKYTELEQCASDKATTSEAVEANRRQLNWIETRISEIDEILNV
jgi:hypothetical protein